MVHSKGLCSKTLTVPRSSLMNTIDLSRIEPFEICPIRPPTENYSLTFRLTRNCGWNRCLFCPVYKQGVKFSQRSFEEIKDDVDRAKAIDDLLGKEGIRWPAPGEDSFHAADMLIAHIEEAHRSSLQTTDESKDIGNKGTDWFSSWFRDTPSIEESIYHVLSWRMGGGSNCFIGDSNSLIISPELFMRSASYIRQAFPDLTRFTIYGRTRSAADMKANDLEAFAEAGLNRVHFGLESGCDEVLAFMKKGVTAHQHILGCRKTSDAGISCGVYVMPGLGGVRWTKKHASETARVLTAAAPDYVRLRTLEIFPGTTLESASRAGDFVEATEDQVVREIRTLVEQTETETAIVSDSASNLLDVSGRLPEDRAAMLSVIDEYLALPPREKLAFSLSSRLASFISQYGGITQEIIKAVIPYLKGDKINIGEASDSEVEKTIRLIRSKLMP